MNIAPTFPYDVTVPVNSAAGVVITVFVMCWHIDIMRVTSSVNSSVTGFVMRACGEHVCMCAVCVHVRACMHGSMRAGTCVQGACNVQAM